MSAPSRPDLITPPCPTCGADVERTYLDTAHVYAAGRDAQLTTTSLASRAPSRWNLIAGAPDSDLLTLAPCGHHLVGPAAHAYKLAALNATHPDLVYEIRIQLPAALTGRAEPTLLAFTAHRTVGHIREQAAAGEPAPAVAPLNALIDMVRTVVDGALPTPVPAA